MLRSLKFKNETEIIKNLNICFAAKMERDNWCVSNRDQSWALSFNNKKWFLSSFIELVWLGVGFLNGAEIGH